MKLPYKFKKNFPNILTSFRLVIAPIIILFGLFGNVKIVLIFTILGSITDLFDGYLARKWEVSSQFGAKLDAVSDKIFAASLLLSLTRKIPNLLIVFLFEIIIALSNLYFYKNLKKSETLMIGKIKTTSLFICIVLSFIFVFFHKFNVLVNGFIYMTLNLQVLSLISYILNYIDKMNKIKKPVLEDLEIHKEIMQEENTLELNDIKTLVDQLKKEK
jgi:CDP-diacylglycerol--glycerol-3-phosphate 3-phosphatidyltransferase